MIVTEEDRRRRRRRQLRALKATLKVTGQERLYRVCLRRAWKTERETRSRDQSTTSSRFYDIPLSPYIRILILLFPLVSSRFFVIYFSSILFFFFFLSSVFSHFSVTLQCSHFSFASLETKELETRFGIVVCRGVLLLVPCTRCIACASSCKREDMRDPRSDETGSTMSIIPPAR